MSTFCIIFWKMLNSTNLILCKTHEWVHYWFGTRRLNVFLPFSLFYNLFPFPCLQPPLTQPIKLESCRYHQTLLLFLVFHICPHMNHNKLSHCAFNLSQTPSLISYHHNQTLHHGRWWTYYSGGYMSCNHNEMLLVVTLRNKLFYKRKSDIHFLRENYVLIALHIFILKK